MSRVQVPFGFLFSVVQWLGYMVFTHAAGVRFPAEKFLLFKVKNNNANSFTLALLVFLPKTELSLFGVQKNLVCTWVSTNVSKSGS